MEQTERVYDTKVNYDKPDEMFGDFFFFWGGGGSRVVTQIKLKLGLTPKF